MITIKSECTACGACAIICPSRCITLSENDYGFVYPVVNKEMCMGCNACERVCHLNRTTKSRCFKQLAYAVRVKSDETLERSTSGGAFSAIAEYVLSQHGVIYGCAYTKGLKAVHIRIDSIIDLNLLNGSKYVQSEIGKSFIQVKKDLKDQKLVLFSGTPCQIAALIQYLGNNPYNLITVDIVCHGVSSQAFFDKYLEWFQEKHNCILHNYDFRSKHNGGWSLAGECNGLNNKTGKRFVKKIYYYNQFYYYYFLKGVSYRESCFSCKYANLDRPGDFTLGDMWGAEKLDLAYNIQKGCSLMIVNSKKAKDILRFLNLYVKEIDISKAAVFNTQLIRPSDKPNNYCEMSSFLHNSTASIINEDFLRHTRVERVKGFIKYHTPMVIKTFIKRRMM